MTVVGVVGGGQLARMMIPAAINLGLEIRVFAGVEDSPAALATTQVGDYRNIKELSEFARGVDVLTFDHEHVPTQVLETLRDAGITVAPSPEALALTHDKIVMRTALASMGAPQPLWAVLDGADDPAEALHTVGGFPCIAKKPVGGYDGKGVRVIDSLADVKDWLEAGPILLEEKVSFVRELALLSARRVGGQWQPWAPVETRQHNGVCSEVIAPAPGLEDAHIHQARELSASLAEKIGVVGVLAVEVFELSNGSFLVNELAMRPHNSGHVLTELSLTSQFEQHLRAVTDLPLGSCGLVAPSGVMANIFGSFEDTALMLALEAAPEAKIHRYNKAPRDGRKVGHVVVLGQTSEESLGTAQRVRDLIHAAR
jgi:5-(carboxyamino)imidazole ribonucleotide synthase